MIQSLNPRIQLINSQPGDWNSIHDWYLWAKETITRCEDFKADCDCTEARMVDLFIFKFKDQTEVIEKFLRCQSTSLESFLEDPANELLFESPLNDSQSIDDKLNDIKKQLAMNSTYLQQLVEAPIKQREFQYSQTYLHFSEALMLDKKLPFNNDEEIIKFFTGKEENSMILTEYLKSKFSGTELIKRGMSKLLSQEYRASRIWDRSQLGNKVERPEVPKVFRNYVMNVLMQSDPVLIAGLENDSKYLRVNIQRIFTGAHYNSKTKQKYGETDVKVKVEENNNTFDAESVDQNSLPAEGVTTKAKYDSELKDTSGKTGTDPEKKRRGILTKTTTKSLSGDLSSDIDEYESKLTKKRNKVKRKSHKDRSTDEDSSEGSDSTKNKRVIKLGNKKYIIQDDSSDSEDLGDSHIKKKRSKNEKQNLVNLNIFTESEDDLDTESENLERKSKLKRKRRKH